MKTPAIDLLAALDRYLRGDLGNMSEAEIRLVLHVLMQGGGA